VLSRVFRKNLLGKAGSFSQTSPMAAIEPILAELCRQLNRMAKSITQKEFMSLANDIIEDTPTAAKVKEYQRRICGLTFKEDETTHKQLGKKYFYNFMKRYDDILHTSKINKNCLNRLEWATYENVNKMYDLNYAEMLGANIAIELDKPVFFDRHNNIVDDDDESRTGIPSNIQITDPSYLIFVDETGSSTNMKKDKPGRTRVLAEIGCNGNKRAISSDIRYTTMGFTAADGQLVMCCIIFTSDSKKGIPESKEMVW
jgi:hypothetical protein